jgi:uncharacterized protein
MPKRVWFPSKGVLCAGLFYVPEVGGKARVPAIVMAHGLSAVKEQALPEYAARFVRAGFATLVFDYRHFGESEGEPRCQLFPLEMIEDYRNAISWVTEQPEVDPRRVGIWGTSFSGGYVLYLGAFDRRVKAVVSQVPAIGSPVSRHARSPDRWERDGQTMIDDRILRYGTGAISYVKVVAPPGEPCIIPGKSAYDFFTGSQASAPGWRNGLTRESLEKMREFDNVTSISLVSPTPLAVIAADADELIPTETLRNVYDMAGEPKEFHTLPITHFEIYGEPWLSKAAALATDFFSRCL